ncbi:MAG: hypothetical protein ACJAYK_002636 [Crocinitomicaceae bacterium]|jgi:hypothetical protein
MNPILEQLKDIHLPDPVSWWPLAWPWWLLLTIIAGIIIFTVLYRKKNAWRSLAIEQLNALEDINPVEYSLACNRLLKQICYHKVDKSCASLNSLAWLEYLDCQVRQTIFLPQLKSFAFVLDDPSATLDTNQLKQACSLWIRKVKC